jgi:hypothetical protein
MTRRRRDRLCKGAVRRAEMPLRSRFVRASLEVRFGFAYLTRSFVFIKIAALFLQICPLEDPPAFRGLRFVFAMTSTTYA